MTTTFESSRHPEIPATAGLSGGNGPALNQVTHDGRTYYVWDAYDYSQHPDNASSWLDRASKRDQFSTRAAAIEHAQAVYAERRHAWLGPTGVRFTFPEYPARLARQEVDNTFVAFRRRQDKQRQARQQEHDDFWQRYVDRERRQAEEIAPNDMGRPVVEYWTDWETGLAVRTNGPITPVEINRTSMTDLRARYQLVFRGEVSTAEHPNPFVESP